jgi:hypothetical protein
MGGFGEAAALVSPWVGVVPSDCWVGVLGTTGIGRSTVGGRQGFEYVMVTVIIATAWDCGFGSAGGQSSRDVLGRSTAFQHGDRMRTTEGHREGKNGASRGVLAGDACVVQDNRTGLVRYCGSVTHGGESCRVSAYYLSFLRGSLWSSFWLCAKTRSAVTPLSRKIDPQRRHSRQRPLTSPLPWPSRC